MKYPWLAAAMNFILPGSGYLYLGVRIRFGTLLLAATFMALFVPQTEQLSQTFQPPMSIMEHITAQPTIIVFTIAASLAAIAFAYDAYSEAKLLNQANKQFRSKAEESSQS